MSKLLVGYALSTGLWAGSVGLIMLALTGADTLPENALPINIAAVSLIAVLIILPPCLLVWSIRSIRNGTMSKAGLGIPVIAGVYMAVMFFFVGGRFLNIYTEKQDNAKKAENALEQERQIQETLRNSVTVSLGQQFTLRKGQAAKIADTGIEVFIRAFCPTEPQCTSSSVGVELELRLGQGAHVQIDKNRVRAYGYDTIIVKTDNETYVDLVVEKTK
ncbi:MAG: hypothetical protein AAB480_00100 [Patescibacteria group bacterium]